MRTRAKSVLALAAAVMATALPTQANGGEKKTKDPNEIICEKQSIVGSRLATRRVCGTRAEWAEKRRLDKEAIDQGQRSACMPTHTGATGRPAC